MPIRFRCESCESRIKVPDGAEGRRVRCPRCGHLQRVPEPDADLELIDTPPNAPPSPEELPPPPPPPPAEAPDETTEPAAEEAADAPEPSPAETAAASPPPTDPEDETGENLPPAPAPQEEDAEEEAAQQEQAPRPAPEPATAEQLELDAADATPATGDASSLFDRAQAESHGVPDRLEEGTAITARDVIGRDTRDAGENDRPEPPSQLMATAAPKPAPRPRATPKPPPSIPLGGTKAAASSPNDAGDRAPDPSDPAGGDDQPEVRPAGGIRLAPRDPSVPPPTTAHQPPPAARRAATGPLVFLPSLMRVVAMLLAVAGIVHVVQLLGVTTRIAALFVYAVMWLAAAGITWTIAEIAAVVDRQRR